MSDLAALRLSLGARIGSGAELIHLREKKVRPTIQTMLAPLDRALGGGLQRGKITEIVGRRSGGRFGACIAALASVTSCGEAAALIDFGDHLDPQLAAAAGVDLPRLLWVRPESMKHALIAADLLISTGFPLVIVDLGIQVRGRRVADATWVRLARTAESYGAAVVISSPFHIAGTAAEVVVSAHSTAAAWTGRGKSPRILTRIESTLTLEKHRRLITGRSERLKLRYEEAIVAAEPIEESSEVRIEEVAAASA